MFKLVALYETEVTRLEAEEAELWAELKSGKIDPALFSQMLELTQTMRMQYQNMLWMIESQSYFVALVDGKAVPNTINGEALEFCKLSKYQILAYGLDRKQAQKFVDEYVYEPPRKKKWYERLLVS